ncbi:TrmH family RNA methyltransferase [Corynebacterium aquatimens]|uniref:TrmH family RNA methyltransferase n=1 Tax=Corynebacterium aquatimens TaxID=1190508 RepID=UPI00361795DD
MANTVTHPAPRITVVADPSDPRLDDVRDLKHSDNRPDLPGGKGYVIAEGPLVAGRLVESRFPLRCVVGFERRVEEFAAEHGRALCGVPLYAVTREVLAEAAGFDMHRGLLAVADRAPERTVTSLIDDLSHPHTLTTLIVLEGVGDHENIGAIFRNAAGMGVDGVLLGAGTADPLYRRSVRVSMGHVLRTPFARMEGTPTTWQRSLDQLREAGFHIVALTPAPDAVHLRDAVTFTSPDNPTPQPYDRVAFLVGAEGPGLTEHAMRACDVRAQIPMAPGTDSLNVATSAAIAFYERNR